MEEYSRSDVLGEGSYGKVYKATHIPTGRIVALKKTLIPLEEQGIPQTTLREISILRTLDHPYIVRLDNVFRSEARPGTVVLFLAFEFLDHDLRQFMDTKYGKNIPLEPLLSKHFCFQILLGLRHCHARGILHRDLKPQNLLVDLKSQSIKIADFGLARQLKALSAGQYTHQVVTRWYRAPEILLGTKEYAIGIDMWSVGCILAEMVLGTVLFMGDSEIEQLLFIFKTLGTPTQDTWPQVTELQDWHTYPQFRTKDIRDFYPNLSVLGESGVELLRQMLELSPKKRITAADALKHSYFDDIREDYFVSPNGRIARRGHEIVGQQSGDEIVGQQSGESSQEN